AVELSEPLFVAVAVAPVPSPLPDVFALALSFTPEDASTRMLRNALTVDAVPIVTEAGSFVVVAATDFGRATPPPPLDFALELIPKSAVVARSVKLPRCVDTWALFPSVAEVVSPTVVVAEGAPAAT